MKKIVFFCLVLTLVLFVGISAKADIILDDEGSADMLVKLSIPCRFLVCIPERVSFEATEAGDGVSVSVQTYDVYLWSGSHLDITVHSSRDWYLKDGEDGYAYSVSTADSRTPLHQDDRIMSVPSGTTCQKQVLNLALSEDIVTAGEFTDRLTFTVKIAEA